MIVTLDGKTLTYGVDYKLEYTNNTAEGEASFVVVGIAGGTTNYSGQTDAKSFTIVMNEVTIAGVSVSTKPEKTIYTVGEKLDPTGLVLTLAMSDGTTQTVAYSEENASDFAFDPETFEAAGATDVTVTYGEHDATFTVSVEQPAEPEVVSVALKSAPSKTSYKVGESLDPSGLVLEVTYDNGETEEIAYNAADFAFDVMKFNSAGEKIVTVTYKGMHNATFTVTVTADEQPEPQPETHTVTVVLGNGEEDLTFEVEDGKTVSEPAAPARDGFKFAGWFTTVDPETGELSDEYDFSTPVKSDLTIYAGWLPETSGEQPGGDEPGTGEQPGDDQKPGQPTTPDPGRPGSGATGGDLAQTGDPTTVGVALATAVSGAIALAASRKRR